MKNSISEFPPSLFALWMDDIPLLQETFALEKEESVLQHISLTHCVMPMEPQVIALVEKFGIKYVLPDALLSADDIEECNSRALEIVFSLHKDPSCGQKISLLRYPLHRQLVFLFTAESLARSWKKAGVCSLRCLHEEPLRARSYYKDTSIPRAVWQDVLGDTYNPLYYRKSGRSFFERFKRCFILELKRLKQFLAKTFSVIIAHCRKENGQTKCCDSSQYELFEGSIVFFLQGCYAERDSYIIKQVKRAGFPVTVILWGSEAEAVRARSVLQVPVFTCDLSGKSGTDSELLREIREKLYLHVDCSARATSLIAASMGDFDKQRNVSSAWVKSVFTLHRPALAFIVMSADFFFRCCEQACAELDLPTVQVPHALTQNCLVCDMVPSNRQMTVLATAFCEEAYLRNTMTAKVTSAKGLFCVNEYPTKKFSVNVKDGKRLVLFILNVSQLPPAIYYFDGPSSRIQLLRALCDVPPDLEDKIDYVFKLHPAWHEKPLFERANVCSERILPLDSDLGTLMEQASVAVCVNYSSSPAHQALLKGVPLIHLNTMSGKKNFFYDSHESLFFDNDAPFAFSVPDMWNFVRKVLSDDVFRESVVIKQDSIVDKLFSPSLDMDIGEIAKKIIHDPLWIERTVPVRSIQRGYLPESLWMSDCVVNKPTVPIGEL